MLIDRWSQDLWHHLHTETVELSPRMVTFCLRKCSLLPVLSLTDWHCLSVFDEQPRTVSLSLLFILLFFLLPSSLVFIGCYLVFSLTRFLWSVYFTEFRLSEKCCCCCLSSFTCSNVCQSESTQWSDQVVWCCSCYCCCCQDTKQQKHTTTFSPVIAPKYLLHFFCNDWKKVFQNLDKRTARSALAKLLIFVFAASF